MKNPNDQPAISLDAMFRALTSSTQMLDGTLRASALAWAVHLTYDPYTGLVGGTVKRNGSDVLDIEQSELESRFYNYEAASSATYYQATSAIEALKY